jgi:hypothetical protein
MVLVDTSVWIDFLAGRPEANIVGCLLESEETLAYTGSILQELMQGCPGEGDATYLSRLPKQWIYNSKLGGLPDRSLCHRTVMPGPPQGSRFFFHRESFSSEGS